MSEIEKTELEKIQSLLLGVWAIEDKHNDEYSDSVKEIVNVCNDKIDALLGVEQTKEEKKNRISLALKDPILQQWFIDNLISLEEENVELKEKVRKYQIGMFDEIEKRDKRLTKAKEIILKLYNAGRDVLMCRAEEKAYDNLSVAINDRSIERFLSEVEHE